MRTKKFIGEQTAPRANKKPARAQSRAAKAEETAEASKVTVAADPVFDRRLARHYDELKWLYCELYHGDLNAFDYFVNMLRRSWEMCIRDSPWTPRRRPSRKARM